MELAGGRTHCCMTTSVALLYVLMYNLYRSLEVAADAAEGLTGVLHQGNRGAINLLLQKEYMGVILKG